MTRIALFTNGIYPYVVGGIQKHSYYLAKYFAQNKVEIDLYHLLPHDQDITKTPISFTEEEEKYINILCIRLDKPSKYPGHYIRESYVSSRMIYETFKNRLNVDFVYAQGLTGWYYVRQKSKGTSLPPIGVNFHGLEMFQATPFIRTKLDNLLFRYPVIKINQLSDYTFSLGGKLTNILRNIVKNDKKIIVTPIGISKTWLVEETTTNIEPNQIRKLVFVGRYEKRKGVDELTIALTELKSKYDFEMHFIGPIPKNKRISSTKVTYHGLIRKEEKIKHILKDSDILIAPSYSEGMPTVILEAMASGCAIIATDVGAVSEEVDKSNGWLIAPRDPLALRLALIEAIEHSDTDLEKKKNQSIQKIKDNFLWEDVAKQTINKISYINKDRLE